MANKASKCFSRAFFSNKLQKKETTVISVAIILKPSLAVEREYMVFVFVFRSERRFNKTNNEKKEVKSESSLLQEAIGFTRLSNKRKNSFFLCFAV